MKPLSASKLTVVSFPRDQCFFVRVWDSWQRQYLQQNVCKHSVIGYCVPCITNTQIASSCKLTFSSYKQQEVCVSHTTSIRSTVVAWPGRRTAQLFPANKLMGNSVRSTSSICVHNPTLSNVRTRCVLSTFRWYSEPTRDRPNKKSLAYEWKNFHEHTCLTD